MQYTFALPTPEISAMLAGMDLDSYEERLTVAAQLLHEAIQAPDAESEAGQERLIAAQEVYWQAFRPAMAGRQGHQQTPQQEG